MFVRKTSAANTFLLRKVPCIEAAVLGCYHGKSTVFPHKAKNRPANADRFFVAAGKPTLPYGAGAVFLPLEKFPPNAARTALRMPFPVSTQHISLLLSIIITDLNIFCKQKNYFSFVYFDKICDSTGTGKRNKLVWLVMRTCRSDTAGPAWRFLLIV